MIRTAPPHTVQAATARSERYGIRGVDVFAVVLFWTFLAFVSVASRELDPRIPGLPEPMIGALVRVTYLEYALWAVITLPIWWLTSRFSIEGGRRVGRITAFLLLGFLIAFAMDALLFAARQELLTPLGRFRRRPSAMFGVVGDLGFLDDLMVYFAVLGAGVARDYFLRYRARLRETLRLQNQLAHARLDALRAQLNPHFLFNTLNAVSALVERDPKGVRRMIARLSDLLRYTLDESTDAEVPLRRELDLLAEYVELMQIRFQGRLQVTMDVDAAARDALVPNLILQPILENAIKHGVGRVTGTGEITIRARRMGDALLVTIADNGPGPGAAKPAGVGLRNTNERLREMYGPGYAATLAEGKSGGTEADVLMPFHTEPVLEGMAS